MEEKEKIVVPAEMCDRAETEKEIVPKKKSLWKQLVMGVVLVLVFIIIHLLLHLEERHRPALSYKCPYCGKIGSMHTCDPAICKKCGTDTWHCSCNDMESTEATWGDNSNE